MAVNVLIRGEDVGEIRGEPRRMRRHRGRVREGGDPLHVPEVAHVDELEVVVGHRADHGEPAAHVDVVTIVGAIAADERRIHRIDVQVVDLERLGVPVAADEEKPALALDEAVVGAGEVPDQASGEREVRVAEIDHLHSPVLVHAVSVRAVGLHVFEIDPDRRHERGGDGCRGIGDIDDSEGVPLADERIGATIGLVTPDIRHPGIEVRERQHALEFDIPGLVGAGAEACGCGQES